MKQEKTKRKAKSNDNLLIIGRNPIKEAIFANRVKSVLLSSSFDNKEILALLKAHNIPFSLVTKNELDSLAKGGVHQGIIAQVKPYSYYDLDEVLNQCQGDKRPIFVMLDGINDPHNMGAILRSCDVFGVKGLIIAKHNQVPLNETVAKVSAGGINYVPTIVVTNLVNTLEKLKELGFWIVSLDGQGTTCYQKIKYDFPTVLVVGSEGKGISSLVLKHSDYVVKIPQFGHVNSLNASVAAGILLSFVKNN